MRVLILAVGFGTLSIAAYCQQQPIPQATKAVDQKTPADDIPKVTGEQTMSFWMARPRISRLAKHVGKSLRDSRKLASPERRRYVNYAKNLCSVPS